MNIVERVKAPTPKFFKVLRAIGLALLGISGTLLAAPIALPALVISTAGYVVVAGGVLSAISQITVDHEMISNEQATTLDNLNKARDGVE